ncbi:50S ribosomal protein L3 [Dethiobacter alkaliphilus]|uniref:50S ribosomal protein L3 n=1 Tax=Dethiobacter alkaliphilus TaxID=427926 RepID=UPI0022261A18|nr:50S ribosomal protein L3 [Dethiobacter alkaliphilus]MCW3491083.1 50S ribosomal protein L3 [Dethiobacter alkaliphilus]
MQKAILGKKVGMTQVFTEEGKVIPVTVIEAGPCVVVQKKTEEVDGYEAVQFAFGSIKEKHVTKPLAGHFKKAEQEPKKYVREMRLEDTASYEVGQEIKADVFAEGDWVDISGVTRGKGFAGAIKRHGFGRGPTTHGSHYHRGPGSLGAVDAARVFKGRKLPGRMGGVRVTVQKLKVVKVDTDRNLLLIHGAVPGPRGGLVTLKNTVKNVKEAK